MSRGDDRTLSIYDAKAADYAKDWLSQPTPREIHEIARAHFKKGEPTADIGSGSGRDTSWLNQNGYPCTGFDASAGLLAEARKKFPHLRFEEVALPDLLVLEDGAYRNVLCETVLMHLPAATHLSALRNLLRITHPDGVLSMSWRHPVAPGTSREKDGRLYEAVDKKALIAEAERLGAKVIFEDVVMSPSSGKTIEQLVLAKTSNLSLTL